MEGATPFPEVGNILDPARGEDSPQDVLDAVAAAYGVTQRQIMGQARTPKKVMEARHVARWLMYKNRAWSYPRVAKFFNCNHTTVINSVNWAGWQFYHNAKRREKMQRLYAELSTLDYWSAAA